MTRQPMWRPSPSTSMSSGITLIVVAIAAITLSRSFDGFVQGLLSGAGIALTLIGVAALSPLLRRSSRRTSGPGNGSTTARAGSWTPDASTSPADRTAGDSASDQDEPDRGWLPSRDSRP
ncbi:hypothetical protein [Microlunatus aurantiacus]